MNKKLYLILLAVASFAAALVQKIIFTPTILDSMIAEAVGGGLVIWVLSALPVAMKGQRWTIPISMAVFVIVAAATFYSAANPPV